MIVKRKKRTLRFWVLVLVTVSILLTFCNSIIAGYLVNRESLINHTLEINKVYAEKISTTADLMFKGMKQDLEVRAIEIAHHLDTKESVQKSLDLIYRSTHAFNAVGIVTIDGKIVATSPDLGVVGRNVKEITSEQVLQEKRTYISSPIRSLTGKLIVFISTPIRNKKGDHIGLIFGSIYLEQENILKKILGEHFYTDGSYVFVVDKTGRLIYHPDMKRIGQSVSQNRVVQKLMNKESGSQRVTNTLGIDMLAGYGYVPSSEWGVVAQTPVEVALEPGLKLVIKMIMDTIPFSIVLLLLSWLLTQKIVSPLRKLANYSEELVTKEKDGLLIPAKIPTWYYEADQLNRAIRLAVSFLEQRMNVLKKAAATDPLTGLANRRLLDYFMNKWIEIDRPFSMILFDVDHFKQVNDHCGHQVGDDVLVYISQLMQQHTRSDDVCCRYGGEEFVILLPDTPLNIAHSIAERLRIKISQTNSPTGYPVTISVGVGSIEDTALDAATIINRIDEALYKAKQEGRNRTVVATS